MNRTRWILVFINVALILAVGTCIWAPVPAVEIPQLEQQPLPAMRISPTARGIPSPNLNRSLFRSAAEDTVISERPESASAPQIRLIGVLLTDSHRVAIVEQSEGLLRRLSEGDKIDGWLVATIEPRAMTLTGQERLKSYHLDPLPDNE